MATKHHSATLSVFVAMVLLATLCLGEAGASDVKRLQDELDRIMESGTDGGSGDHVAPKIMITPGDSGPPRGDPGGSLLRPGDGSRTNAPEPSPARPPLLQYAKPTLKHRPFERTDETWSLTGTPDAAQMNKEFNRQREEFGPRIQDDFDVRGWAVVRGQTPEYRFREQRTEHGFVIEVLEEVTPTKLVVVLPDYKDLQRASPEVRKRWIAFADKVRRHEEAHVSDWKSVSLDLLKHLAEMPPQPDSKSFHELANKRAKAFLNARHQKGYRLDKSDKELNKGP